MMRRTLIVLLMTMTFLSCGSPDQGKEAKKSEVVKSKQSTSDDICAYFPKELLEAAIGKPIVKVEPTVVSQKGCAYYTEYREDYYNVPGGKSPGGRIIQVMLDDKSIESYKADKLNSGNLLETAAGIKMENLIVKRKSAEIRQVALVLGSEKYIRIYSIQDAVDGPTLVKIGAKLAEALQNRK